MNFGKCSTMKASETDLLNAINRLSQYMVELREMVDSLEIKVEDLRQWQEDKDRGGCEE